MQAHGVDSTQNHEIQSIFDPSLGLDARFRIGGAPSMYH